MTLGLGAYQTYAYCYRHFGGGWGGLKLSDLLEEQLRDCIATR